MVKRLASIGEYLDYINEINRDPDFREPMLANEEQMRCNLLEAINKPSHKVWGIFDGEEIIGLFNFLVEEEEAYLEMLVGLSRSLTAYEEMLAFLKENYKGYQADFVYNPNNHLLHGLLQKEPSEFYPEQQKMVLKRDVPYESGHQIELYGAQYREQYCALHRDEGYWTAEKVINAPDVFRIILAVEHDEVVGYIDMTHKHEENEPFDMFVKAEHRKKGFAKAMLAKAIALNRPGGMMALVDADNTPAIALYGSLGFDKAEGENNMTAHVLL